MFMGILAPSYAQVKFWIGEFKRGRNGYELIPHPTYSPDLAPSDFFLFPNLKKNIRGLMKKS